MPDASRDCPDKGPIISDDTPRPLDDASFKQELAAMLPHLRAFGRSLTGNADLADDLVQETMLKAWKARARYIPGPSSMKSWAFVILRNCFLSQMRRKKFTADYDELAAERLVDTLGAGRETDIIGVGTHDADYHRIDVKGCDFEVGKPEVRHVARC